MTPEDAPAEALQDSPDIKGDEAGALADLLAKAFPEVIDSKRIVQDAGLDWVLRRAGFYPAADLRWWDIIQVIRNRAGIEALLTRAVVEQRDNRDLVSALEKSRLRGHRNGPVAPQMAGGTQAAAQGVTLPELPRLALGPERRLIDREEAVAVIRSGLTSAAAGRAGSRLLLIGDSGVGKTRLAEQGMRMADERGMVVLLAQCIDQHAEPLLPLRDGLANYRQATPVRDLLRAAGGEPLTDYAPFLEAFLGIGAAAGAALGGSGGRGVYEGLAQVLLGLAGQAGLCLIVDDLTDADYDTLSFIEYLGRKAGTGRVVTITTAKEDLVRAGSGRPHPKMAGGGLLGQSGPTARTGVCSGIHGAAAGRRAPCSRIGQ